MEPVTVLLLDKHPVFLRILNRFLGEHFQDEVRVLGAATGMEEAVAQAQALRPQVILLDIHMPGFPCLAIIPRLRSVLPQVGIIALSLMEHDSYREAAFAAGADEFVSKATVGTSLLPAIQRVVRAEQPREEVAENFGVVLTAAEHASEGEAAGADRGSLQVRPGPKERAE